MENNTRCAADEIKES
nr:hypothetical protein [Bacillus cereus]